MVPHPYHHLYICHRSYFWRIRVMKTWFIVIFLSFSCSKFTFVMDENFGLSSFQVHCGHPQLSPFYTNLFSCFNGALTMRLRWSCLNRYFFGWEKVSGSWSEQLSSFCFLAVLLMIAIIYLSHAELKSYPESSYYNNLQETKVGKLGEKQTQSARTDW